MKMNRKSIVPLILDFILILAFLFMYEERATGNNFHEWLGVTLGLALLIHILYHWNWLICMIKNFFGKLSLINRFKLLLNLCIFLSFSTIIFSGLMMSKTVLPSINIHTPVIGYWRWLHFTAVDLTLWLTVLHIAINWKRFLKLFSVKINPALKTKLKPVTITIFLKYSFYALIIIVLSATLSLGWYNLSGTSFALNNRLPNHGGRFSPGNNRDLSPTREFLHVENQKNHRQFYDNNFSHNQRDRDFSIADAFPGITKNIFLISLVTAVVYIAGIGMKNNNPGDRASMNKNSG